MKKIILIVSTIILTLQIKAKTIHLMVKDGTTNEPLIGANISIQNSLDGAVTDIDGMAMLDINTEQATYVLISYVGYTTDSILVDKKQSKYEIALLPDISLEEVQITAKQKSNYISALYPIKTEKINNDELRKAACCNLSESFQTNSGVDVNYQDAATGAKEIKLLGLRGIYIQNLLNNLPALRGLSANYSLDNIPAAWISNISISKGMPSVKSGYEGITGSLNVELQNPIYSKEKFYIDGFGNSMGRIETNMLINHEIDHNLGTSLMFSGGFNPLNVDRNDDGFLDQTKSKQYNFANAWSFNKKNVEGQYLVKALSEDRISGQTNYNPITTEASDSIYGIHVKNKGVELIAKTGFLLQKHNASIGTQFGGTYYKQDANFDTKQYNGIQGSFVGNILYQTDIKNDKHTLVNGINFTYDNFDESFLNTTLQRDNYVIGLYAEYSFKLPEKFTLVAGYRADYSNVAKFQFNPRVHIKYNITKNTILFVAGGKGFRIPNLYADHIAYLASSRDWQITNNPTYETAWNYGASFIQNFEWKEREGSLIIDYYRTDFLKQIIADIDQADNIIHIDNLNGKSFSNSLLVEFNTDIVKGLNFKAAYRWEDVKSTYHGVLLQKPLQAIHKGLVTLSYETPKQNWQFDIVTAIVGKQRLPNSFSTENLDRRAYFKAFVILNAQITKKWKLGELFFGLENLTNFTQQQPILNADNPYKTGFDANQVWGPINGITAHGGFRFWLDKNEHND